MYISGRPPPPRRPRTHSPRPAHELWSSAHGAQGRVVGRIPGAAVGGAQVVKSTATIGSTVGVVVMDSPKNIHLFSGLSIDTPKLRVSCNRLLSKNKIHETFCLFLVV